MQVGSAFGVLDPRPPGSPMLAAAPQKAVGTKSLEACRATLSSVTTEGTRTVHGQLSSLTTGPACGARSWDP